MRAAFQPPSAQNPPVCLCAEDRDDAVWCESIHTLCCSVLECPLCSPTKWTDNLLFSMETLHLFHGTELVMAANVSSLNFQVIISNVLSD